MKSLLYIIVFVISFPTTAIAQSHGEDPIIKSTTDYNCVYTYPHGYICS